MEIRDKIIEIIAKECDIDQGAISESATLDELGVDSPHLLEIVLAIEETFGLKIRDGVLTPKHTVGDVIDYVQRRVGK
jgi:acyl carrier protein